MAGVLPPPQHLLLRLVEVGKDVSSVERKDTSPGIARVEEVEEVAAESVGKMDTWPETVPLEVEVVTINAGTVGR